MLKQVLCAGNLKTNLIPLSPRSVLSLPNIVHFPKYCFHLLLINWVFFQQPFNFPLSLYRYDFLKNLNTQKQNNNHKSKKNIFKFRSSGSLLDSIFSKTWVFLITNQQTYCLINHDYCICIINPI